VVDPAFAPAGSAILGYWTMPSGTQLDAGREQTYSAVVWAGRWWAATERGPAQLPRSSHRLDSIFLIVVVSKGSGPYYPFFDFFISVRMSTGRRDMCHPVWDSAQSKRCCRSS
jgi:hypothetical protein